MNDSKRPRYIHVTNWFSGGPRGNGFQRFKDRKPNWIRLYFDLAKNDDWRELTGHRRAVLIGLWMEYGMRVRRDADDHFTIARGLLDDTSMISRDLALRVTRSDVESLNHAGFIYFSEHKTVTTGDASDAVEAQIPRGLDDSERDKPNPTQPVASNHSEEREGGDPEKTEDNNVFDLAAAFKHTLKDIPDVADDINFA